MKNRLLIFGHRSLFISLLLCTVLFSCKQKEERNTLQVSKDNLSIGIESPASDSVRYAGNFRIESHDGYILAIVRNPWDTVKILQQYVLVPKTAVLPDSLPEGVLIRTPLERTVSYGSVQCSFFGEFGALPTLVGVCEPQYIYIPFVQEGIRQGNIADLGQSSNPDIEKIMLIEPEALFTAPVEGFGYGQVAQSGIPLIECVDYMESSPLGRAEWIRFFALFFDKKTVADSLFRETENNYRQLQELASEVNWRPSVMSETIYRGVWYVPGGNSYVSHLFRDAGADYLWKEDTSAGSLGLSFETVLEKAEKADYWLIKYNSNNDLTYDELVKSNSNYAFFDAYKKRKIYGCNTGKTTYYEDIPIHPDYILKDMVWIFHPELLPEYQPKYYDSVK